jgi:hypothetical protein
MDKPQRDYSPCLDPNSDIGRKYWAWLFVRAYLNKLTLKPDRQTLPS